ncbi:MAG: PaaI family thioesterase [Calditrichaceae bacterium]
MKKTVLPLDKHQTEADWKEFEKIWNESEQLKYFGFKVDLSDPEHPVALIPDIEPHHLGGLGSGFVNGAIVAALCDLAVGLTGSIQLGCRIKGTAELNIRYLYPLVSKSVKAVGKVERVSKNLAFTSADVYDDSGKICAIAQGIVACSSRLNGLPDEE